VYKIKGRIILEQVLDVFKKLNIEYNLVRHPAIFSRADEYKVKDIDFNGVKCKNLFVKDKKGNQFYLVSLPVVKRADLKKIADELGCSRLSFGNEEELWEKLHIKSGSVSVLNVIGAPKTDVIFVIDKDILNYSRVSFHPNDNTASVSFNPINIEKIMKEYKKEYLFLEVEE
jgi:Ala-tRNA(Pro) deacylase